MLKANLWCPACTCGAKGKERDFNKEVEKENDKSLKSTKCPNNNKTILKHMGFSMLTVGSIDASKKYAARSPKERYERRTNDFIKNTLPTLGTQDKLHFRNKLGLDKNGKKKK